MIKNKIYLIFGLIILAFASVTFISAENNVCCEKTTSGAWCQPDLQSNCDSEFLSAPTSCESTSFCKKGCCYDSREGLCMESTSQRVCSDSGGTWNKNEQCEIPQCNLGCCVLGDQGAFVTMARCKQMSGFYGLISDFRNNILDEVSCLEAAGGEEKGACVYEDSSTYQKTCTFTTRSNCPHSSASLDDVGITGENASTGFYGGILCSAEELATNCGPSTKTAVLPGKDEIYFTDTCGNLANIYDTNRYDDQDYWKTVYSKAESCGYGNSNAGSRSCGNCDYMRGSIAKKSTNALGKPTYGSYICADLNCKKEGKKHGESWCETDAPTGNGLDTAGSRYYREICLNGEVLTEPCADYRNQICIESEFNSFSEAACRPNRWQDCTKQLESDDCENQDQRDCSWFGGYYFSEISSQVEKVSDDANGDGNKDDPTPQGMCLPNFPPGFNFWGTSEISGSFTNPSATQKFNASNSGMGTGYVSTSSTGGTTGEENCNLANAQLTINWEKVTKMWPQTDEEWTCAKGEKGDTCRRYISDPSQATVSQAEAKKWANDMNQICFKLGDCGGYSNFLGKSTTDGYAAYLNNKRIAGLGGSEVLETKTTAKATTTTGTQNTGTSNANSAFGIQGKVIWNYIKEKIV